MTVYTGFTTMASTRGFVGTLVTSAVVALAACSSSSPEASPSGNLVICTAAGFPACTAEQRKPLEDCVAQKCATTFSECYGADYRNGNFSGPCGSYIACTNACACEDTACRQKCGQADTACTTCIGGSVCASECALPACTRM